MLHNIYMNIVALLLTSRSMVYWPTWHSLLQVRAQCEAQLDALEERPPGKVSKPLWAMTEQAAT